MTLDTIYLANTGIRVSEIVLGTAGFGNEGGPFGYGMTKEDAHELLDLYEERGGNFIDTADRYGNGTSETWIGEWLADRDRDNFVIASKIGRPTLEREDLSRKYLRSQLDAILDRLGTDYVDILYAHRWDEDTAAESVMRTFDGFVESGRVHHLGTSTRAPNGWQITLANEIAEREGYEPFTVAQPRYNLVLREIEGNYLDVCRHYDIAVIPYNAIGEGFLAGKYSRDDRDPDEGRAARHPKVVREYFSDEAFDLLDAVREIADEVDASPVQVSLAWLVHHPDVTAPIIGSRKPEQLAETLGASEVSLTAAHMERLTNFFD